MNKIEVLRSDKCVRNVLNSSVGESDSKISEIFKQNNINSVMLSDMGESISNNPLKGMRVRPTVHVLQEFNSNPVDIRNVLTSSYVDIIKNNLPLESIYEDPIRGSVIRLDDRPTILKHEFEYDELDQLWEDPYDLCRLLTNNHNQYKQLFLITEAVNKSKITNVFKGKDLSNGACLSFWLSIPHYGIRQESGVFTFIGDYSKKYYDSDCRESDTEYAKYTPYLQMTSFMNLVYDNAFHNNYKLDSNIKIERDRRIAKILHRINKCWAHVIVSFTNSGSVIYLNGIKVPCLNESSDKSFGDKESNQKCRLERQSICDFLSDDKTELFLAVNINRPKSNGMLFDDITFYDGSVESEEEALSMFEEACKINLP